MAGGHAGAAVRDHRRVRRSRHPRPRTDGAARRPAGRCRRRRGSPGTAGSGPGMCPGTRVDGVLLAAVAVRDPGASRTTLRPDRRRLAAPASLSAGQGRAVNGDAGALRRGRCLSRGVLVGRQAAIEQRGRVAGGPEHPHQPRRDHPARIVVPHDHGGVVADPAGHPPGEQSRVGQRMTANRRAALHRRARRSRSTNTAPGRCPSS